MTIGIGTFGNDVLNGGSDNDVLVGLNGNDRLNGFGGIDVLNGGAGNDRMAGGLGADIMVGGPGNDAYFVESAGDLVLEDFLGGVDIVFSSKPGLTNLNLQIGTRSVENLTLLNVGALNGTGNALNNVIIGNAFANVVSGLSGNDTLRGNGGNDTLNGGNGIDFMFGGSGVDTVNGNAGNDVLSGGQGIDTLVGGSGFDFYLFDAPRGAANADFVQGFFAPADTIRLDNDFFPGAGPIGPLNAIRFKANAAGVATDATDRIVYDNAGANAGALFYDSNGSAAGGVSLFARLIGTPTISAADFVVVG
jgi:Ca2+-binding RTX toxin-like protein